MPEPFEQFPSTLNHRLAELDTARARLLAAIEATRAHSGRAPAADGGWSVAEIAYHLHLAENATARGLGKRLASSDRREPVSEARLLEEWERIRATVGRRIERVQAPAGVVPESAPDLDRAVELLAQSRRALLDVVEGTSYDDLLAIDLPHPLQTIGLLAGASWLSVTAYHDLRHAEQIREIVAGSTR
jgi:hypothetical protein